MLSTAARYGRLLTRPLRRESELARHAAELRARGVDAGGGHFYYIERPEQITDLIASEVGELLEIVARDAAIELTAPDGVTMRPLSPFRFAPRGNRALVHLGDLVAGQHLEVVSRIKFGYGTPGSEVGILVGATDREGILAAAGYAPVALGWQYADDAANDAQPRDRSVDRGVAALFAARARQEAVRLNRQGQFGPAVAQMRAVARRISGYSGSDPELQALVAQLQIEEHHWAAPAPEAARKVAFAAASYSLRSRGPEGRAGR